jgi:EAL domain-containing protein (putative c-di-GMP-specific phosphodiesterase class I)
LVRGPGGSELESPAALFAAARSLGLERELDHQARHVAIAGAATAEDDVTLFVNVEPGTLDTEGPLFAEEDQGHRDGLRLVVEFTERELAKHPGSVIQAVRWLRDRGISIALDDIGVDRRSLALLPFLAPDVMKLDMSIIQKAKLDAESAHVVNAVAAEAERSGALILAEGIETEAHLTRARSFGATLGQGWLFGRPAELPDRAPPQPLGAIPRRGTALVRERRTPFDVLSRDRQTRSGDKRVLLALSRQLESEATMLGAECVVLATFQRSAFFTTRTRDRYERLATSAALVGGIGMDMGAHPALGVRGGGIPADDPLAQEWDVVVISPFFAGAFVARDLGDDRDDMSRRFQFCMSYERERVLEVARILIERIVPPDPLRPSAAGRQPEARA